MTREYIGGTHRPARRHVGLPTAGLAVIAALLLSGTLAGVPASAARSATHAAPASHKLFAMLPKSIRTSKTLTDIINLPYPPMEFKNAGSSTTTGFDIDMAKGIASEFGVKLQFQNVLFQQIFPSVTTHRGDFAWTAVFDLKQREKKFNFIDYFKTGSQLYTSTANASKFKTLKSLCGKTVVVPTGTTFGKVVSQVSKSSCGSSSSIKQVSVQSPTEQNLQVREGRADAAISGPETVLYLIKQQPGKWSLVGPTVAPEYYAVVLPKNSGQLQKAMVAAMKAAWKDGTYKRILKKWGLTRNGIAKPLVNHAIT